jgi:WhiB family redox-sensing transcriptional regulator
LEHATDPRDEEPSRPFFNQPWAKWARCQEIGGDWHYPEATQSASVARSICARCEVRPECLEWALVTDERFGVWGGLTYRERMALLNIRDAVPCDLCDRIFGSGSALRTHTRRAHGGTQ